MSLFEAPNEARAAYEAGAPRPTAERTQSVTSDAPAPRRTDWTLIIAMDCQSIGTDPESLDLAGLCELSIGRGPGRSFKRSGARARLDLPDRWMSLNHARLVRTDDRWWIEDQGSRNGCRLAGEPVTRARVCDGDVFECGGTYLVLRRGEPAAKREPLPDRPEPLRTLSPALERELEVVRKVAHSPLPVLVLGESGTGKEGMASVLHSLSGRAGPFVALNCGAIPSTLVESVLFGSRRGAYSGAQERHGLVRTAEGGTLFLDEVGELPLSSQAALLRMVEDKMIRQLGAAGSISVDVRIVAATNRPVREFVEEGRLRRDLYARLRGYELRLPPLRERREDLGHLVATLLARHDCRSLAPRTLSRDAASALFTYAWPLNIRELEQCLSAALAIAGSEILLEHLPGAVRHAKAERPAVLTKREQLVAIIQRHGGNLSAVARELATSSSQLYRLLSRHSIGPDDVRRST